MADFNLKQNDRLPIAAAALKNPDGSAVNLAGTAVRFIMRLAGSTSPKIAAAATITSASTGGVSYGWTAADTDTAGTFQAEFEVTFGGGLIQTYPNTGYLAVSILDDLG